MIFTVCRRYYNDEGFLRSFTTITIPSLNVNFDKWNILGEVRQAEADEEYFYVIYRNASCLSPSPSNP